MGGALCVLVYKLYPCQDAKSLNKKDKTVLISQIILITFDIYMNFMS